MHMYSTYTMLKRSYVLTILILLIISSLQLSLIIGASVSEEEHTWNMENLEPAEIKLKSRVFDPVEEGMETPSLDSISSRSGSGYYLIQFPGPIQNEWLDTLESSGVEILEYIPDYTYLVGVKEGPKLSTSLLSSLPIRWAGEYEPEHRLHPRLLTNDQEIVNITVLIFNDENTNNSIRTVKNSMNSVLEVWIDRRYTGVDGSIKNIHLEDISKIPNVYWIEPFSAPLLFDEVSSEIVGGNWTAGVPWGGPGSYVNSLGYDGTGQKVAVVDTGIDGGRDNILHPDLNVVGFFDYTTSDGTAYDGHGHGTHVAGIVAGDGSAGTTDSDGYLYGMGVAPGAELVAQKVFTDNGSSRFPNLNTLMADTYNSGAYVSSNSWGSRVFGEYTSSSARYDGFVRDALPNTAGEYPMIIVFASGNDGPDPNSVGAPGTAKNVITVGASENYRPYISSNANNIDEMASFSSRGPTNDGRIKPDIVAPGTIISSALSSEVIHTYPLLIDEYYHYLSGTSMAAPHVSGGAAIFVQYYEQEYGVKPSPALTKAAMILGANDMNREGIPNFDEGWGRMNLSNIVQPREEIFYQEQFKGLSTGEHMEKTIYVGCVDTPLKVVLTWTDPPASPNALTALVNDLDLTITGPDGKVFRGNQFKNGWSDPFSTDRDELNNVEAIYIDPSDLRLGEYTIEVYAQNVPMDGVPSTSRTEQDFAMVSSYVPPSQKANIGFDRNVYNTETYPTITLTDTNISHEVGVNISSLLTGDKEIINLTEIREDTGVFTGDIELTLSSYPIYNNSKLEVIDGDEITVSYVTRDYGTNKRIWVNATARIDVTPPHIDNVSVEILPHGRAEISWNTDEPSTSKIIYGRSIPPDNEVYSPRLTGEHRKVLAELQGSSTYYFYLESTDEAGNTKVDDNDGEYYNFTTPRLPKILLVDDDNSLNNNGPYENRTVENYNKTLYSDALTDNGYEFGKYVVPSGKDGPPLDVMDVYELVIWVTGYNGMVRTRESTLKTQDFINLGSYLDTGGSLWLIGGLIGNDLHGRGDIKTSSNSFLRDYMGVDALYSNHEPTDTPVDGVYGTFMEDIEFNINSHWKVGVNRYDIAYELKPTEDAFGVLDSGNIKHPYYGIAYEKNSFRTAFFSWELSFVRPDEMKDAVGRAIDWFLEPPVGLHISPQEQTGYGLPSETVEHELKVFNTGINGADTYDILVKDTLWDHEILHLDGTPISDTNGNGVPDTGRISKGGSKNILLRVNMPHDAEALDEDGLSIVMSSTLNPFITARANIRTVVPVIPTWHDDFEEDTTGWSTLSEDGGTIWELGDPSFYEYGPDTSFSGSKCWGTNLLSNYTENSETTLTSPPISLKGVKTAELSFMHWYDMETSNDGGVVELSHDGGITWSRITAEEGYPYTTGIFGGLGGEAYSGRNRFWAMETFDLFEYRDKTIMLRWRFASAEGKKRAGWYMDDVNIFVSEAGIKVDEPNQGRVGIPVEDVSYTLNIKNLGDSEDVFSIGYGSELDWEVNIYTDLWEPISDKISMEALETVKIYVNITVPSNAQTGAPPEKTEIILNSSVDPLVIQEIVLFTYPKANILLVNNDGNIGSSSYYKDTVAYTGRSYNEWMIDNQGPPDPKVLLSHDAVIWFTGNHRGKHSSSGMDPLPEEHRDIIEAYLKKDGKLYLSSQGAGYIADEEGYVSFMEEYFGFRSRLNWWAFPNPAYGVDKHPISDMMDLGIYREDDFFQEMDDHGIYGEVHGKGEKVFRLREGFAGATAVDDTFRTLYTGFDFSVVTGTETRNELMRRILAWLTPDDVDLTADLFHDSIDGATGTTVEHKFRVRNLGKNPDDFSLEVLSENGWNADIYHKNGTGPIEETGYIPIEGFKDLNLKVSVPKTLSEPTIDNITVKITSTTDTDVNHTLMTQTVVPEPNIMADIDEFKIIVKPNSSVAVEIRVHNKGGFNDTIDVRYNSTNEWNHTFTYKSTDDPLFDSSGSGAADTDNLFGLSYVDVNLIIDIPEETKNGVSDFGSIDLVSNKNNSLDFTTPLNVFVPVRQNWTDDMESGEGGWLAQDNDRGTHWEHGDVSGFEYGPGTAYSGDNSWGTNLLSNYTRTGIATLTSPVIDLKGAIEAEVSFHHWFSIWGEDPGDSEADGGFLEVSKDLGETWEYVIPNEGYNETISPSAKVDRCYGQNSSGWLRGSVNLTKFIDDHIMFRFHFYGYTPGTKNRWAGWYIDNFQVNATFKPVAMESSIDRSSNYVDHSGKTDYYLSVTNLGADEDSFSLIVGTPIDYGIQSSTWTYNFYDENSEPLVDTNEDGFVDTGEMSPQETKHITLEVIPPDDASPGIFDEQPLKIMSSNDETIKDEYTIHTMVPNTLTFYDDIESGKGAWRHYWISGEDIPDNWQISENRAYSGNHSWWSGPEIATWSNGGSTALETPFFDLSDAPHNLELTFWHWYFFESYRYSVRDGGIVDIWDNVTGKWHQIHPERGYDRVLDTLHNNPLAGREAFTDRETFPSWIRENFILRDYVNRTIKFRFRVGWSAADRGIKEGWYIDDLHIGAPLPDVELDPPVIDTYSSPGETTTHILNITNSGKIAENFELSYFSSENISVDIFDSSWSQITDTGNLEPDESLIIFVNTTTDASAYSGMHESLHIYVSSFVSPLVECMSTINISVPITSPYQSDFEDSPSGWTHGTLNGMTIFDNWQIMDLSGRIGKAWWSGREDGEWPVGGTNALISPYIDLSDVSSNIELSFTHYYDFGNNYYGHGDGGVVEIWDNETQQWTRLEPERDYPGSLSRRYGNPLEGQRAFIGSSGEWIYDSFDLSHYQGNIIRVRFVVGWDLENTGRNGWYISDVYIGGKENAEVDMETYGDLEVEHGLKDVVVGRIDITANDHTVTVEKLNFHLAGSGNDNDIEKLYVYLDTNEDGKLDPDIDMYLGHGSFSNKKLQLNIIDTSILAGETVGLLLVVDVSQYAPVGTNLCIYLVDNNGVRLATPHGVSPFKDLTSSTLIIHGDDTNPMIMEHKPSKNATDIGLEPDITIKFDKPMDTLSVERGIHISDGEKRWEPSNISWDAEERIITFSPPFKLAMKTEYHITLNASYVKDKRDNFLDGNGDGSYQGYPVDSYSWSFTTVTEIEDDTYPPHIVTTQPANGSAGVLLEAPIIVTFNESMNTSRTPRIEQITGYDPGGWNFAGWNDNYTAVWTHGPWQKFDEITIQISNYTDAVGYKEETYTWSFKTLITPYESAWPVFKQNQRRTGHSPYITDIDEGEIRWMAKTEGKVNMQPVIGADETVYVGDDQGYMYAFTKDGELLWNKKITDGSLRASPSVGIDETIYIGCSKGYLHALERNGTVLWSVKEASDGVMSSPVIGEDGTLYFGSMDGNLYAVNPNGTLAWRYPTGGPISSSPALANDTIYVNSFDGSIYAIRTNGSLKWSFDSGHWSWNYHSPIIGENDIVYAGINTQNEGHLFALNGTGEPIWSKSLNGSVSSSPSLSHDGTLYIAVSTDDFGIVHAYDSNGKFLWEFLGVEGKSISDISIDGEGVLYISSSQLHAIKPNGTISWSWSSNEDQSTYSTPTLTSSSTIYVSNSEGYIKSIGEEVRPPISTVDPDGTIPKYTDQRNFTIPFYAADDIGLDKVTLYYRMESGDWEIYDSVDVGGTEYIGEFNFTALTDGSYEFFIVATNVVGHTEPEKNFAETVTIVDTIKPQSTVGDEDILYTSNMWLDIPFSVEDETRLKGVLIYVRKDAGSWELWRNISLFDMDTSYYEESINFTTTEEGVYNFYSIAIDAAGNKEEQASHTKYTVVVDVTPPGIIYTSPYFDAKGILTETTIQVDYDEKIDESSIEIWLREDDGGIVMGNWILSQGSTIIFTPDDSLKYSTNYTVIVRVSDIAGNSLETIWNFQTVDEIEDDDEREEWPEELSEELGLFLMIFMLILFATAIMIFFMSYEPIRRKKRWKRNWGSKLSDYKKEYFR